LNPRDAIAYYNLACAYVKKGNKSEALKNLKKVFELDRRLKETAKKDSAFDPIRSDPEFTNLLK